ncbi:MAG: hypothetical protein MUC81_03740 [Bacteroidia bacterium]|jgi:capsular polysaccharide biosynthesis protein|nr:hypothetical protein [Bacteroidia bacterium]
MQKTNNEYSFNFISIVQFILKWRKHLLIICLSSAILALIITSPFIIKPQFKSKAIFYPGTINSISYALFYSVKERAQDVLAYGDEDYVEQYLQLALSNELRTKIANDFNLLNHYEIDPNDPKKYEKLNKRIDKMVSVNRTSYNGVEVVVYDTDPQMAASLANAIMYNTDTLKRRSQYDVAAQTFVVIEQEYRNKIKVIDSLTEMTRTLGKNGVYNVEEQSRGLAELIGKGANNDFTRKERDNLAQYVGDFVSLDEQIRFEAELLTDLRKKYHQAKIDLEGKVSNIFVVEKAVPSESKAYPLRIVAAIISMLASLMMSTVVIIGIERYKNIKQLLNS